MNDLVQGQQNPNLPTSLSRLPRLVQQVEIAKHQGVQFFDITNEQFALMVGYVTTLIGCALPSVEATMILITYCRDQFPFTTDREFKLACELNASGKFESVVQHYNSFDAQFMGTVLSKYREYENKSNKERAKVENKELRPAEKSEGISEATARDIIAKDLDALRQRKSMTAAMLVAPIVMDWILANENCDWITDEKFKAWHNEAYKTVGSDMQYGRERLRMYKQDNRPEWTDFVQKVITERKRIAYLEYLKKKA